MSRIEFDTGEHGKHQKPMIRWVRSRLADQAGKLINDPQSGDKWQQHGVLIADGVGMGKTWEALGAVAVLLYKKSLRRKDGDKRKTNKRQLGRVLIVVPPNLVEKWSGEIYRGGEQHFHHYLKLWHHGEKRRRFILETLSSARAIRRESDIPRIPIIKGCMDPGGGVFIVSNRLITKPKAKKDLKALRQASWDVVIVDEAHHKITNQILKSFLPAVKNGTPVLLLSATPFQLSLNELRPIFNHIGRNTEGSQLIKAPSLKAYLDVAKTLTTEGDTVNIPRGTVHAANRFLSQIIARNSSAGRGLTHRQYHFIKADGSTVDASVSADAEALADALAVGAIKPSPEFEEWYLRNRIRLGGSTLGGKRTCVATDLRQLLSTPRQAIRASKGDLPPESPRLEALIAWFRKAAVNDLNSTIRDGLPRKTIVFTSFVKPASKELQDILQKVWTDAVTMVSRENIGWREHCSKALDRLQTIFEEIRDRRRLINKGQDAFDQLRKDLENDRPRALLLALSSPKYEKLLKKELGAAAKLASQNSDNILEGWGDKPDECDAEIVEHADRIVRIHRRDTRWLLSALTTPSEVARFDGESSFGQRGEISFAFQTMVGPWVLVASRVGSEGIDLHTWARRLVHFDLEWNPAVMEQREGRCDRIGRQLKKDPLDIYYLVVQGTYDERMLHQVAVRQQWHRLILGINRAKLDVKGDLPESMTQHLERLEALDLNLSPGKHGR